MNTFLCGHDTFLRVSDSTDVSGWLHGTLKQPSQPSDISVQTAQQTSKYFVLSKQNVILLSIGYIRSNLKHILDISINPTDIGTITSKYVSTGSFTIKFHRDNREFIKALEKRSILHQKELLVNTITLQTLV